ncbi:ParA family protein [Staphylococcus epidermidis]|uniref:ParA family protein n=1 Tax=Staphylococcus epidermidis TaxID=1282 RepID=UPI002174E708|nr:AAA family ATPase [Staphylococcus epidermidis]
MKVTTMSPLKGGTAKTSTILNLAGYHAKKKNKVLTMGLDSQKNLSNFLQKEDAEHSKTIYDVLVDRVDIKEAIYPSRFENIDYVADSKRMGERNVPIDKLSIKEALQSVYKDYDYVLIDNAPVLTSGVISSFVASDNVIITTELERFSLENITDMINEIVETNDKAEIYIVPVKAVTNSRVHREVRREIENFTSQVDYLHLADSIPFSIEMTNRIYDGEILVQHKAISKAHRRLKKSLEKLTKEID